MDTDDTSSGDNYREVLEAVDDDVEDIRMLIEEGAQFDDLKSGSSLTNASLITACKAGSYQCVCFWLDNGADLQCKDVDNVNRPTPLHLACKFGHLSVAQLLIECGADVNAEDATGMIPLVYSVDEGQVGIVQMLIEHGADVHAGSPILVAAKSSSDPARCVEIVEILLRNGADVNVKNSDGNTALTLSCWNGKRQVMDKLLQSNADVNVVSTDGRSVITYAIQTRNVECVQTILGYVDGNYLNSVNCYRQTALSLACFFGNRDIVKLLLEKEGVDVNVQDKEGRTPLMCAIDCQNWKFLKSIGVVMRRRDCLGTVDLLLKHGADVNISDKCGCTILFYFFSYHDAKCLERILNHDDLDVSKMFWKDFGYLFSSFLRDDGSCLEKMLKSKKCDSKICGLTYRALNLYLNDIPFEVKSIWLTMQTGIFDWSWCSLAPENIKTVVFPALLCGVSPGRFYYYNEKFVSPLIKSFLCRDFSTIKYLLANLYFFPEDYRILFRKNYINRKPLASIHHHQSRANEKTQALLEQLTTQPLSLQTWSFLVVSKSVSQLGPPFERSARVDSLPLPEHLKKKLKFKSDVSQLCIRRWNLIHSHRPGDLVFGKTSLQIPSDERHCTGRCGACGDKRGPKWAYLYENYSSTSLPNLFPAK